MEPRIYHHMKQHAFDKIVLIICVLNIVIHIPFLSLPANEDEVSYIEGTRAIANNHLNPFVRFWGYKPPTMFVLPAVLYSFTGTALPWGHLEAAFFSSITLWFLYLLTKKFLDPLFGLYAVVLLWGFPLFTAQSFLYQDAISFAAMFIATLYFYFNDSLILYGIFATLLVFTKEPGVFLPAILFIHDYILKKRVGRMDSKDEEIIRFLVFVAPEILFILWMLINKALFGWFLWPVNTGFFSLTHLTSDANLSTIIYYAVFLMTLHFFWFVSSVIIAGFLFIVSLASPSNQIARSRMYFLGVIVLIYYVFHLLGPINVRYFLFLYPILFVIFLMVVSLFIRNKRYVKLLVCILFISFLASNVYESIRKPNPENNEISFGYMREIQFRYRTINTMLKAYPKNAIFLSEGYITEELMDPVYGYVHEKTRTAFAMCKYLVDVQTIGYLIDGSFPQRLSGPVYYIQNPYNPLCPSLSSNKPVATVCADDSADSEDCVHIYFLYNRSL